MSHLHSPLKLTSSAAKKSRLVNNWNLCIICQLSTQERLSFLTGKGKQTLTHAFNTRKDDLYRRVTEECTSFDDVDAGKIGYHKSCYKSYTSKANLEKFTPANNSNFDFDSTDTVCTRSKSQIFNWDTCIFCRHKSYKSDRQLRRLESTERVDKISEIANQKGNIEIKTLISTENIQDKALYHRACIANFLLNTQIKDDKNDERSPSEHDEAFARFVASLDDDLIVHKKAFFMSQLVDKFCSLLSQDLSSKYTSAKLQRRLINHYGSAIAIQRQQGQGKSNIVFSSAISVADAIHAASKLKADLELSRFEEELSETVMTDEQVLHSAALILRNDMQSLQISNEVYPTPSEVSLACSAQYTPASLTKFLMWLAEESSFNGVDSGNVDTKRKVMAIAECLMSINKSVFTPFQLGLALQLHHEFGSKKLIETLNSHGFCASYSEVRTYLTSLANLEISRIQDTAYVPNGVVPLAEGGRLIQEGADNIDINAETIDGKNTFHSMARAVFQMQSDDTESRLTSIVVKRGKDRSLLLDDSKSQLMACLPFSKPKERHGPPRLSDAYGKVLSCFSSEIGMADMAWVFLRLISRQTIPELSVSVTDTTQTIPFWTGFCKRFSKCRSDYTFVAYAPVIDAKPSDMATVYTTMKQCIDMSKLAGQQYSVQTFDQQLYAVAQQVKWSMPDVFHSM